LSTALHAAALSLPSAAASTGSLASKLLPHQASPNLVKLTLLIITLPVEIVFLSILRGLGWLSLPFIFVGFSLLFFCVAVSDSFSRAHHHFLNEVHI
jgi:solute carrier family 41